MRHIASDISRSKQQLKILYGVLFVLMLFSLLSLVFLGLMEYNVSRIVASAAIIIIPLQFGEKKLKEYKLYVILAMLAFLIGDVVNVTIGMFPYANLSYSLGNILLIRAFYSFQGYTFKIFHILLLFLVVIAFYYLITDDLGDERPLVVSYMIILAVTCWQGINQFAIRKSFGAFYILLSVLFLLLLNILKGVFLWLSAFHYVDAIYQITYWLSMIFLAHSTTIEYKKFFEKI